jgi:NIPSNAP
MTMIYELRIYSCLPGRLPALLKRFETQTLKIWDKYGIKQAGFWTVLIGDGNNDLYYLLAWQSMAEREQKWTAFQADPAWIAARSDSERDGPILSNVKSMFLQPTAFSSVR